MRRGIWVPRPKHFAELVQLSVDENTHLMQLVFLDSEQVSFDAEFRAVVGDLLAASETTARQFLPELSPRFAVTVRPTSQVIPETGVTGRAVGADWIQLSVDPTRPSSPIALAQATLQPTFLHECHHLTRTRLGQPSIGILAASIFEGLATAFERDRSGQTPLWGDYQDCPIQDWTTELLTDPAVRFDQWIFRHPDGRRWIGYRVGTYLADRATESSGLASHQLVGLSTDEILSLAGVTPTR